MKKVWKIYTLQENNIVLTAEQEEHEKLYEYYFDGESVKSTWDASVKLDINKKKSFNGESDFLGFCDSFFVVSKEALKVFNEKAAGSFETLDFVFEKEGYCILNVFNIIDCIDMQRSKYRTYKKDPDSILKYEKLYINFENIGENNLFVMKHHEGGLIACTDELKMAIEDAKLYGVGFELLDECI